MNNIQKLYGLAFNAAKESYSPYSNFAVGVSVVADNGHFYVGCNVENISYPVGSCAETGAIAAMIVGGGKKIAEMLIYADSKSLITPCGACRQRILEFSDDDTMVYLADAEGVKKSFKAKELLPFVFEEF